MEFFKKTTQIDFMGLRRWATLFSSLLFLASLISLLAKGLYWGLDFTGGTQLQLTFPQAVEIKQIRTNLKQAGFQEAIVQSYGTSKDIVITLAVAKNTKQQVDQVLEALPQASLKRVDYIGPQVGQELANKGILAVIVALFGTLLYISLRFEYRFAIGAAVALIHDPILILGVFSLFRLEFNLTALAGLLAVIGYSLNDTIVIFDRIRENFRKIRKESPIHIVNLSINQTLSRTLMTSATTLVVVLVLFLFGGPMIHEFSIALIVGMIVGTYSSIYVAGALAVALGLSRKDLLPVPKQNLDSRP